MALTPTEAVIALLAYITLYSVLRSLGHKWRIETLLDNNKELRRRLREWRN